MDPDWPLARVGGDIEKHDVLLYSSILIYEYIIITSIISLSIYIYIIERHIHPVLVTRFRSQRAQPLEDLSAESVE